MKEDLVGLKTLAYRRQDPLNREEDAKSETFQK